MATVEDILKVVVELTGRVTSKFKETVKKIEENSEAWKESKKEMQASGNMFRKNFKQWLPLLFFFRSVNKLMGTFTSEIRKHFFGVQLLTAQYAMAAAWGNSFVGVGISDAVNKMTLAFVEFTIAEPDITAAFTAIGTGAGGFIELLANLNLAFPGFNTKIAAAFVAAGVAVKTFGAIFLGLGLSTQIIIVIIGAAIAYIVWYIVTRWDKITAVTKELATDIKVALTKAFNFAKELIGNLVTKIMKNWEELEYGALVAKNQIISHINFLADKIVYLFKDVIGGAIGDLIAYFKKLPGQVLTHVTEMLENIITKTTGFTPDLEGAVAQIIEVFLSIFKVDTWTAAWGTLKTWFLGLDFSSIGSYFTNLGDKIVQPFKDAKTKIDEVWNSIKSIFTGETSIGDLWGGFKDKILNAISNLPGGGLFLGTISQALEDAFASATPLQEGGHITKGGLAMIHTGETVVPAGGGAVSVNATFNIYGNNIDSDEIVRNTVDKLRSELTRLQGVR